MNDVLLTDQHAIIMILMEVAGNRLAKIRTFRDDVESLLPSPKKADPGAQTGRPTTPKTTLPPVMAPLKPKPEVVSPSATAVPVAGKLPLSHPEADTPPASPLPNIGRPTLSDPLSAARELTSRPSPGVNILTQRTNAVDYDRLSVMEADEVVAEGTIITDQKRERFALGPAIQAAVGSWFQETKENIADKTVRRHSDEPTVRTLEDRKQVVEKASKQSALAPKDDHEEMTDRLPAGLNTKAVDAIPAFTIKEKGPEQRPSWHHFEGKEAMRPKAEIAATVTAKSKPKTAPIAPASPVVPPPPVRVPKTSAPKVEPVELTISANTRAPAPERSPTPPLLKTNTSSRVKRLALTAAVALMAVGAAGGGVMLTLWFFEDYNQGGNIAENSLPGFATDERPLFSSDETVSPPLPRDRGELYSLVIESGIGQGTVAVLPVVSGADGSRQANTEEVLAVLNWQASAPLLRAIEQVNFGMKDLSPFIVIKTTSFDTAFGGILAAEANLSTDLAPLFGEPVTATFDQRQAANEELVAPFFADDVVQNHDVRVLRDELQKERIVYGFINKNTIIVAPDRDTFRFVVNDVQ
jgi:hypothetical protein